MLKLSARTLVSYCRQKARWQRNDALSHLPWYWLRPLNSDLLPTRSHTGNCLGLGSPIPPTRLKMGMTNDYSADATGRVHER